LHSVRQHRLDDAPDGLGCKQAQLEALVELASHGIRDEDVGANLPCQSFDA
jgi:hypothetical protein